MHQLYKKKITKFWLVCIFFLLIIGSIIFIYIENYPNYWVKEHLSMKVESQFVSEQDIEKEEYMNDFFEICDIIEKRYILAEHKGISLKHLRQKYSVMVSKARNNKEYFTAIKQYFSELKNAHTNLIYNKYMALANAEWRCDSLYITTNMTKLPIETGDRIISIDGVEALLWRDSMENYVIASNEITRYRNTADYVFSSHIDTVRTLCLKRADSVFHVKVELNKNGMRQVFKSNREFKEIEIKEIQESSKNKNEEIFTVLTLTGFTDEDTEEFRLKYDKVKDRQYIILDLLNNSGGLVRNMEKIASFLLKRPYQGISFIKPSENSFKGKLYVMIGSKTFSAAEYLASILKESESAVLVGDNTAGDFGTTPLIFCTSHGTYFSLGYGKPSNTIKGAPREGKGVAPHYRITEDSNINNSQNTLKKTLMLIMSDATVLNST